MTNRAKIGVPILIIILIAGLFIAKQLTQKPAESQVSTVQPQIQLQQARSRSLPVWILFHSKTCDPCIEMEKVFNQLKPKYAGMVDFVDVDVYDPNNQSLLQQYRIQTIPTSFLLDSTGKIKTMKIGVLSPGEMEKQLNTLLGGN